MEFIHGVFVWMLAHHAMEQFKGPQCWRSQFFIIFPRRNPLRFLSGMESVTPLLSRHFHISK
jgi:hypothetical protein